MVGSVDMACLLAHVFYSYFTLAIKQYLLLSWGFSMLGIELFPFSPT